MFLLILLASPLLLFVVHAGTSRGLLMGGIKMSSLCCVFLSTALGLAFMLGILWLKYFRNLSDPAEIICGTTYATIVYGCFAYAYLHLFLMGETARRLHILYELKSRGTLSRTQLIQTYGAEAMLSARLQRLLATRHLALKEGTYVLQKRFLYLISKLLIGWGRVLGFRTEILE